MKIENAKLVSCQFRALCLRRFKNVCRKPFIPVMQVVMPFLVTWFIVALANMEMFKEYPPLLLSLSPFGRSTVVYGVADSHNATAALAVAKLYRGQVDSGARKVEYLNGMPGHKAGDNVHDYLMEKGKRDAHDYTYHTFVAAEFRSVGKDMFVTAFFNFQAYHTSAISLTLVDNALLKYYVGHDYSIETTNHPKEISYARDDNEGSKMDDLIKGLLIVMGIVIVLPMTISSYTLFAVGERSNGVKDAQFISGLYVPVYWAAMFVCDNVIYLASASLIICLFFIYDTKAYISAAAFPATVLVFLLYGWASQPMMYVASFIFQSSGSALAWTTLFNLSSGKCGTVAYLGPVGQYSLLNVTQC